MRELDARPILPTAVVGSYSMPGWLERLKTDFFLRRISAHELDEIHDAVTKAAIKDQEMAGLDIITDGELRRDNMVDYFLVRLPGVQVDHASKRFYYDFYDAIVRGKIPMAPLRLGPDLDVLRRNTRRAVKFTVTGPHCLAKRIRNEHYGGEAALALDLARILNLELRELARAGAAYIQIDEPYYSGFPDDLEWGVRVLNAMVEGVEAKIGLHICFGNRYGKPTWEGSYRYLFPRILEAQVHQLTLEFARRGYEELELFREWKCPFELGLGVIDVKSPDVESPATVAQRIRTALAVVPAERLYVNPDCGLLHVPQDVAFRKLRAMVEGAALVRRELAGGA
ncbi:MAG TPA: methionine synthase [Methylomirabilota bacterium]|nr:methionine synthase [Methylomirabilota bacterium]